MESSSENSASKPRRPTDGIRYGESEFWEEKYAADSAKVFDWYLSYAEMKELVKKHIPPSKKSRILMVGCGNSPMAEHMVQDCYSECDPIVSVDISPSVIHQMQRRAQEQHLNLVYHCMDARDMSDLPSESFDYVMDKGTVDALVCGDEYDKDITSMVSHVFRLLKPGGLYMVVSFGAPQHRRPFFREIEAQCDYTDETWKNPSKPNDPQLYYVYLLRKKTLQPNETS